VSPSPLDRLVEESTASRFSGSLAPAHGDELTWWTRQSSPWDFGFELGNHPTRIWVGEYPRRTIVGVAPAPDFGGVDLSSCYSRTSVARVLTFQDHRIESAMALQPNSQHARSADLDHRVVPFPTQHTPWVPTEPPAQPALRPARVSTHALRQVAVLKAAGRLSEVVDDLDHAIQLALADGPRGVVCDLSAVLKGAEPVAVEVLATAGRHVRDWPGIPVAVACPDPQVREALRAHPLGGHLIVTESLFTALSAVLATPTLAIQSLHLAPHPTAPRASRDFVTRALLDLGLGRVIRFADLLVSELVASSSVNVGTDIDLSVTWDRGALRLTVQDHGPAPSSRQPHPHLDPHARVLAVVAGLSRAFGVLPTADGGKVVWAVLDAPQPRPSTSNEMSNSKDEPVENASIVKAI
jgi:hypothetical protein